MIEVFFFFFFRFFFVGGGGGGAVVICSSYRRYENIISDVVHPSVWLSFYFLVSMPYLMIMSK